MLMRVISLMIAAVCCADGANLYSFIGTVVNTTDPQKTVAAPVQMVFAQDGTCVLTISLPLIGSGSCTITTYDQKSGRVEITTTGPVNIAWSGAVKGNFINGSYRIDASAESGSFYLAIIEQAQQPPPKPAPQAAPRAVPRTDSGCVPAIESAITGEVHGWDGETIFKLDNGQIWQQAEYDYTYFYEYHPDVTIYQTRGGCRMKVEDEEETIVVKRLK
jgi:hypothetical protein